MSCKYETLTKLDQHVKDMMATAADNKLVTNRPDGPAHCGLAHARVLESRDFRCQRSTGTSGTTECRLYRNPSCVACSSRNFSASSCMG
ncbi:hypothetical protein LSAT2_014594 [Lamellibrachia satsuma]|nr:hypothetical protein LSAT2_014594 [Lamellibrachia satsuma]